MTSADEAVIREYVEACGVTLTPGPDGYLMHALRKTGPVLAALDRAVADHVAARSALALLCADIPCCAGCGCEDYDYCAQDEGRKVIAGMGPARAASETVTPEETTETTEGGSNEYA